MGGKPFIQKLEKQVVQIYDSLSEGKQCSEA